MDLLYLDLTHATKSCEMFYHAASPIKQYIHCVKSVRIRSFSGPHLPAFQLNTVHKNCNHGQFATH